MLLPLLRPLSMTPIPPAMRTSYLEAPLVTVMPLKVHLRLLIVTGRLQKELQRMSKKGSCGQLMDPVKLCTERYFGFFIFMKDSFGTIFRSTKCRSALNYSDRITYFNDSGETHYAFICTRGQDCQEKIMSKVRCLFWSKNCTTEGRWGEKGGSAKFRKTTQNLRHHLFLVP